ncbi:centrosomal protein of 72 kDa [Patella vulgata]|uniref:centrosomal protein of 72 kDa n=1 Tax=Patella vulgata TaxID=6465 RepID=UPI002180741B|nr:centrosomal protein of 72 kDa [Patella vulgata]
MALTLTEEIIRDRVNLTHENLEDVKALSLPGTYHEKFVSLGKSLRKFSRLKDLDLSRNNLESLKGMENLKFLETLNLYYNSISTMEELKRLKFNANLKDIDLRLNPVTRNEPDYRLYLIHMLPNLQKLDDRGVRDRERQAALTHFSTGQATEMTYHPSNDEPQERQPLPRVVAINKLAKGSTVLDDDDVAVIDLVSRNDGDLSKPRPITGSGNQETKIVDYSLPSLTKLADKDNDRLDVLDRDMRPSTKSNPNEPEAMIRLRQKYPNIPPSVLLDSPEDNKPLSRQDGLTKFDDEEDAYTKFKSHGYFTANPNTASKNQTELRNPEMDCGNDAEIYPEFRELPKWSAPVNNQEGHVVNGDRTRHRRTNSHPSKNNEIEQTLEELGIPKHFNGESQSQVPEKEESVKVNLENNQLVKGFLFKLLDMVDRYWNGSRSLHKHAKFKEQALPLVEKYLGSAKVDQNIPETTQKQMAQLKEENRLLRLQNADQKQLKSLSSGGETELWERLHFSQKKLDEMQDQIITFSNENNLLKKQLNKYEQNGYNGSGGSSRVSSNQIEDFQRQNEALTNEVEGLRVRLKQYAQLQDLSNMLQESHTSLVQTNEHLLKELEEEQHRHRHEVEQLHWSYDQLKKSINYSRDQSGLRLEEHA